MDRIKEDRPAEGEESQCEKERDGVRKGQQREKREAAAMCVGGRVGRTSVLAWTSAPFSISSSATSLLEAQWRGVAWYCEDRERKGQRKRP